MYYVVISIEEKSRSFLPDYSDELELFEQIRLESENGKMPLTSLIVNKELWEQYCMI